MSRFLFEVNNSGVQMMGVLVSPSLFPQVMGVPISLYSGIQILDVLVPSLYSGIQMMGVLVPSLLPID